MKFSFYKRMSVECDHCWQKRLDGRWLFLDLMFKRLPVVENPNKKRKTNGNN